MSYSNNKFRTPSINLAAFLLAQDYELLGKEINPNEIRRVVFVLRDKPDRARLCNYFLTGRGGQVDIHRLLDAQKRLKNLVHETLV